MPWSVQGQFGRAKSTLLIFIVPESNTLYWAFINKNSKLDNRLRPNKKIIKAIDANIQFQTSIVDTDSTYFAIGTLDSFFAPFLRTPINRSSFCIGCKSQ
jgi:hypothetical protein